MNHCFYYRKGSTWEYIALGLLILFILLLDVFTEESLTFRQFYLVELLFLLLWVSYWRGLYDKSPVIVISKDGIWSRTLSNHYSHPIPWDNISEVKSSPIIKRIVFILKDKNRSEVYLSYFSSTFLNPKPDKLIELISQYLKQSEQITRLDCRA